MAAPCGNASLGSAHAPLRDLQTPSAQKSSRRDFGRQTPRCIASTVDCSDLKKQVRIYVDGLKVRLGNTEKMKLADLLKPAGHVKQDAKDIYYLVEERNTSFDFTFRYRVPTVGQFEMNKLIAKHKTAALRGRAAVLLCGEDDACTAAGHWPDGQGAALPRGFNVRGPNEAGKPAWHRRRQ